MYKELNKNLCVLEKKIYLEEVRLHKVLSGKELGFITQRVECPGCFGALSVTVVCKWQENRKAGDRAIWKTVSVRQESEQGKLQTWGKWHRCA